MNRSSLRAFRCPLTKGPLRVDVESALGDEVVSATLVSPEGRRYPVRRGMPFLVDPARAPADREERHSEAYYQAASQLYDRGMDWLFRSFHEDEARVREGMIDLLGLRGGERVLETGTGTCRDSAGIAARLGPDGELYMQDLSPNMLEIGRDKFHALVQAGRITCRGEFLVGDAVCLPFASGFFDAAYHFGGLNLFADRKQAITEMARVVRVGGKVVVGDEGLGPWHRRTEYGEILLNSNRLYQHDAPLDCLPECAREVCARWILGNAFYLIDFRVGEGAPPLDLDMPIVGKRGGTHRTRFYGQLEGVTLEAKKLALEAAGRAGLSVHEWLDRAVRHEAERALRESAA